MAICGKGKSRDICQACTYARPHLEFLPRSPVYALKFLQRLLLLQTYLKLTGIGVSLAVGKQDVSHNYVELPGGFKGAESRLRSRA
jgi:hypothetical protein